MFRIGQVLLIFLLFLFLSGMSGPSFAKIYKYKDKNGEWKYSDKPPVKENTITEVIGIEPSVETTIKVMPKNLAKLLLLAFPSETPVEITTLSVLSIKTPLGGGTGFFVSNDGYIVTNRHVVRPTTTPKWEKSNKEYLKNLETLATQKENLKKNKKRVKAMYAELVKYKARLEGDSSNINGVAFADFRLYKDRYDSYKQELNNNKKAYKNNKKIIDKQKNDFHFASTLSRTKKRFNIQLKNNSILIADLVKLSKKHDLALLKLKGHITPFIDLNNIVIPTQGSKAYAIGSPLGLRDFVTFGSITHVREDKVITDTQILPGNSGGPLIDTQGRIIGVNTQKLMADDSIGSAGFGVAIPIKFVKAEFGQILRAD